MIHINVNYSQGGSLNDGAQQNARWRSRPSAGSGQPHYRGLIAGRRMRRRDFLGLIGGAAWSCAARAQEPMLPRLGAIKLTEPSGKSVYINVALITFVKPESNVSGAGVELGLASGRVQGVRENIEEIIRLVSASHRGEMTWIKLTEPNAKPIYVNVSQVTSLRADSQIPGANAELGFASGKLQGVRENADDVMQLIAAIAGQQGRPP